MSDSHELGLSGEQIAAGYLERKGFQILARRWRWGHKEIDLVARRDQLVVFVEVKCRGNERFAPLETTITGAKQRNLIEAANGWLTEHDPDEVDRQYRFDVVLVLDPDNDNTVSVQHIEDAFRA